MGRGAKEHPRVADASLFDQVVEGVRPSGFRMPAATPDVLCPWVSGALGVMLVFVGMRRSRSLPGSIAHHDA